VHADETLKRSGSQGVEHSMADSWVADPELRMVVRAGAREPFAPAERTGQTDVVVEAYQAFQRDIHSFLRAAMRDPEAADDLTQETFIRLVREVREGRTPDNVRAWLYTVAANLVTSRARRTAVADRFKAVLALRGQVESPEADAIRGEQQAHLRRALGDLPADARTALLLAAHGFSGHEIARVLGRTDGATRTLLCRARIRLRERFAAHETGGRSMHGPADVGGSR
jgi:RNA polymerase sigma-70 factor (ECF subfamily)